MSFLDRGNFLFLRKNIHNHYVGIEISGLISLLESSRLFLEIRTEKEEKTICNK